MSADPLVLAIPFVGITLHTEALAALAGVAVGLAAARVAGRHWGVGALAHGDLLEVVLWAAAGGRAWYVAEHLDFYLRYLPTAFAIWDGGLAVEGLWLGLAVGLWLLRRREQVPWSVVLPLAAAGLAAARLVQLAGCAATHCLVGAPTSLPWAIEGDGGLQHPLALYGVLLLGLAWLVQSRTGHPWLGLAAYACAEGLGQILFFTLRG